MAIIKANIPLNYDFVEILVIADFITNEPSISFEFFGPDVEAVFIHETPPVGIVYTDSVDYPHRQVSRVAVASPVQGTPLSSYLFSEFDIILGNHDQAARLRYLFLVDRREIIGNDSGPISPSTLVKIPLREALTSVELGNLVE